MYTSPPCWPVWHPAWLLPNASSSAESDRLGKTWKHLVWPVISPRQTSNKPVVVYLCMLVLKRSIKVQRRSLTCLIWMEPVVGLWVAGPWNVWKAIGFKILFIIMQPTYDTCLFLSSIAVFCRISGKQISYYACSLKNITCHLMSDRFVDTRIYTIT